MNVRILEEIMKTISITELRANIYNLLEEVLATGTPLEIHKGRRKLQIVAVEKVNKLHNLIRRPEIIQGDPDDLVSMQWEVKLDLP
jgi:Antitoxin Phd_YefM, type II toxin-antitoxin system